MRTIKPLGRMAILNFRYHEGGRYREYSSEPVRLHKEAVQKFLKLHPKAHHINYGVEILNKWKRG